MLPALDREGWQAEGLTGWVVIQSEAKNLTVTLSLLKVEPSLS